ncbi:MAG: hypothetical protein IKD79_01155, partial [Oscillospiraceae bacterium]|nr:hypothetical protein [Oscillospiraceae bacterium]
AAPEALAGLAQPAAASKRGELAEGSLLRKVGTALVRKTTLTRKVTYDGKTVVYPVYRVRLDALYYNDQNDRIATWITRYESENGEDSLTGMGRDIYNMVIENFIVESNPDAIRKTRNNIALVGQREPGVALADGRIVDGNRRFTCLRQLQRETAEPLYFETVLMDVDIQEDKKQLKLLELAIQHGEEKKVDYDLIDFAVGTYRDVVETRLLTQEEYAAAANESPSEVKARLEIAGLISEFLTFLRLPGQYHAAREYQVYNVFAELRAPLRQLESDDRAQLKTIVFNNTMMAAIPDQRKFIRDIKALVKSGNYQSYFKEQAELDAAIREKRAECDVRSKEDLDRFAAERDELAVKLRLSMERAMLRSRSQQLRAKPAENIGKSVTLLMEIDPRQFDKLDADEREKVRSGLEELSRLLESFRNRL